MSSFRDTATNVTASSRYAFAQLSTFTKEQLDDMPSWERQFWIGALETVPDGDDVCMQADMTVGDSDSILRSEARHLLQKLRDEGAMMQQQQYMPQWQGSSGGPSVSVFSTDESVIALGPQSRIEPLPAEEHVRKALGYYPPPKHLCSASATRWGKLISQDERRPFTSAITRMKGILGIFSEIIAGKFDITFAESFFEHTMIKILQEQSLERGALRTGVCYMCARTSGAWTKTERLRLATTCTDGPCRKSQRRWRSNDVPK